jgi:hypothetical protein
MGQRQAAAQHYAAFLRQNNQGGAAQYSAARLQAWGYLRAAPAPAPAPAR